jgi:8-oxo-dGTP diphosphatase
MALNAERPRPVASVSVVTLCAGAVLLVRRAKEPYLGKWSYPGGSIEPGETSREAARREAFEETGVDVQVLEVADVIDSIFPPVGGHPGYHYVIIDFLAVPKPWSDMSSMHDAQHPTPVAATDVSEARWVPLEELDAYDLTPLARPVLARALERYAEWNDCACDVGL